MSVPDGRILLALVGSILSAPAAFAQDARLRDRLDPETAGRVEQMVDSARKLGLPTEPLVQKALEGKSKGAPNARIVTAVDALLDALAGARASLGSRSSDEELVAGALWIRAGGAAADLAAFRRSAPSRPLAVPIAVSTELLSRGYARAGAVESASALLSAGLSDAEFVALKRRVDEAVKGGSRFDAAVRTEVAKVQAGRKQP
jgi:hypothetical protein